MFYQPNYCSNCGEKIERVHTSLTDSRRFCDVCKHDFVGQRILPVVFVALMTAFGLFGIGAYWRSGARPPDVSSRQISKSASNTGKNPANNASPVSPNSNAPTLSPAANAGMNAAPAPDLTNRPPAKQAAPNITAEAVYFCGAPTKKGTPCSRRVRGGGRCWQHKGQAALLPPEKLLAGG